MPTGNIVFVSFVCTSDLWHLPQSFSTKFELFLGLGTAYRNRTAVYHRTLLHTEVRTCTTVYCNNIKLTVIVNLSAAMGIHLIDKPTSHGV